MKLIPASFEILYPAEAEWPAMLTRVEAAGRTWSKPRGVPATSYKSEDKITADSAAAFVAMLIKRGHHAMIEHGGDIAVRFVCDRGVSHELVRHRIAAFAQESTRFCDYSKEKFGGEITFVDTRDHFEVGASVDEGSPDLRRSEALREWHDLLMKAEWVYRRLRYLGIKPEIARSVLPNALKTEIVVTANVREWRHIFTLRTADVAHPQMREVTRPLLAEFRRRVPVLFDDVGVVDES